MPPSCLHFLIGVTGINAMLAGAQTVYPTGAYTFIPDKKSLMGTLSSVRVCGVVHAGGMGLRDEDSHSVLV